MNEILINAITFRIGDLIGVREGVLIFDITPFYFGEVTIDKISISVLRDIVDARLQTSNGVSINLSVLNENQLREIQVGLFNDIERIDQ